MRDYTTADIKVKMSKDGKISKEVKDLEEKKVVISNDAYAVADLIETLIKNIEKMRSSFLSMR
jgi:orotate phosphoribosyltransferase-like protein